MKVTVVGAGIMGLSVAWAVSRAGHEVTVFDQGPVPNPLGSSVDQHRMTRLFYGDLPEYGPMMDEALRSYETMWADLGESYYLDIGVLGLSTGGGDWTELSRLQMERDSRAMQVLEADEVRRRYPFLAAPDIQYGVYTAEGGVLLAAPLVEALARRLGAAVKPQTRVTDLDPMAAEVTLSDGERVAADRLVVATGPWTGGLLPELAGRVASNRQVVVYLRPPERWRMAWEEAPALVDLGGEDELYAFPPVSGTDIKVGYSHYRRPGEPDDERDVEPGEPPIILDRFRPHFADFDGYEVTDAKTCCYTMTVDRRFIVEALSERTFALSACSGHGFKFAAALGLRTAEAVLGNSPSDAIGVWAAGGAI